MVYNIPLKLHAYELRCTQKAVGCQTEVLVNIFIETAAGVFRHRLRIELEICQRLEIQYVFG